jgi:hypothetical protein
MPRSVLPSFALVTLALPLVAACGGPVAAPAPPPAALRRAEPPRTAAPPPPPPLPPSAEPAPSPPPPPPIPPPGHVVGVVALDVRGCAIFENGMLQCWGGFNHDGELGVGHTKEVETPAWVKGLHDVKKLALGDDATCAIVGSGELRCWGRNWFLADDPRDRITEPARVPGLTGVVDVAVSSRHTCAVDAAGSVYCWGSNGEGQLGLGAGAPRAAVKTPTKVPGISGALGVVVSDAQTVIWTRTGEVQRWGNAADPARDWAAPAPRKVDGIAGATRVQSQGEHTCAILAAGEVRCFTHETLADLAAGKQHDFGPELAAFAGALARKKVVLAPGKFVFPDGRGLSGVIDLIVFNHDASALTDKGEVFSWGSAKRGTAGLPEKTKGFAPPTRIKGLSDIVEIAGSFLHRCALDRAGKVRCFGSGSAGRLGTERQPSSVSAVEVAGLPRVVHIAAGDHCTFALGEDHTLWAWGSSWLHACGLGGDSSTVTPAPRRVTLDPSAP